MSTKPTIADRLAGKMMYLYWHRTSRTGYHLVRIRRSHLRARPKPDGATIKDLTVSCFNPASGRYDGQRVRVTPEEWSGRLAGLYRRRKLVPLEEYLRCRHRNGQV